MTFFDRIATRYDRTFAPDNAESARDLSALLGGLRGVVLDLGCGTGRAFPHLIGMGFRVVGMDASLEMLRESLRRGSSSAVARVRADLYERWPLRDGSIDIVLALHSVLAHPTRTEGWAHVGAELRRVAPSAFVAIDLPEPAWAAKHLRRVGEDRYLFEERGVAIEAHIPEPAAVVAALGLPLRLVAGPLGARAITARSSTP